MKPESTLDWANVVAIPVTPDARCRVYPEGAKDEPARSLSAYAGDEGVIRFFLPPASWGANLTVDCQNPARGPLTVHVDLSDPTTFSLEDMSAPAPVIGERPALQGDPLVPTDVELHERGYPPRPDAILRPATYSRWRDIVSRSYQIRQTKTVASTEKNLVNTSGRGLWGGPGVTAGPYVEAVGQFTLPANNAHGSKYSSNASIWVGLGGSAGDPLIQAGVRMYGDGSNSLFYEYEPNGSAQYPNLPAPKTGNDITIYATACNVLGLNDIDGGHACFLIIECTNPTTCTGGTYNIPSPSGAPFQGGTAEAIIERPCVSSNACPTCGACPGLSGFVQPPLLNYGQFANNGFYMEALVESTQAWIAGFPDPGVMFQLNNSSGQPLESESLVLFNLKVQFQWLRGQ